LLLVENFVKLCLQVMPDESSGPGTVTISPAAIKINICWLIFTEKKQAAAVPKLRLHL
jgi:hypothetical protein